MIDDPGEGFVDAGMAHFAGQYDTVGQQRSKRLEKLAAQYEELGRLDARSETVGAFDSREKFNQLYNEIQAESKLLGLYEEQNAELLKAFKARQQTAYVSTKELEAAKEQKKLWGDYLHLTEQIGKLNGIINSDTADELAKSSAKIQKNALMQQIDEIRPKLDLTRDDLMAAMSADMSSADASAMTQRQKALAKLAKMYKELGKLQATESTYQVDELQKKINAQKESLELTQAELDALSAITEEAKKDALNKQKDKEDKADWTKKVKEAQRSTGINAATSTANAGDQTVIRAIGSDNVSDDIASQAKVLSEQIQALRDLRDKIERLGEDASEEEKKSLSQQITKVKELKTELDGYVKIHEKYSGDGVEDLGDGSNFGAVGTDQYWNNITAAIKNAAHGKVVINGLNADTGELTGTTKIAANTFAQWSATVDPITGRLSLLRTGIKKTETLFESISRKTKEIFTYFSGSSIIFKAFNMLKQGVQYVREIDDALVELRKVTDATAETYDKFLQTAAKTGEKLGATISDVTRATATFSKLGYNISLASEMAEAALVYMNVGDGIESADDAANSIISTMKGFGLATSESMRIVDSFNQVGNEFSVTSKGLGDALQRSAAALNAAGNTLDESIGLITAANTVINDPDSVGVAMKTLALRIRGAKTELAEAGLETENMAETTAKLQQKLLALTHGEVDIMLDANTFKSTTEIIRSLSQAWEHMSDVERAAATELLAGQRQSNVLSALIQNFDIAEAAIEASANSAGK